MPKRTIVSNSNAIVRNKSLTYDIKTLPKVLKDFFLNLAEDLVDKLVDSAEKHKLISMFLYYSNFAFPDEFHINST